MNREVDHAGGDRVRARCSVTRTRSLMPSARASNRCSKSSWFHWLRRGASGWATPTRPWGGGPPQFHGMSPTPPRKWAAAIAQKPSNDLVLDRDADGPGVRDWLASLGH